MRSKPLPKNMINKRLNEFKPDDLHDLDKSHLDDVNDLLAMRQMMVVGGKVQAQTESVNVSVENIVILLKHLNHTTDYISVKSMF